MGRYARSLGRRSQLQTRARRRLRPQLETLEPRRLLAVTSLEPEGTLAYVDSRADSFATPGETDTFSLSLDAGQKLSAFVTPGDASIQARMRVFDPASALLASVDASAPDATVGTNSLTVTTAGTYLVEVTSLAGSGAYTLDMFLNAARELEDTDGGVANDSLPAAESMDATALAPTTAFDRLAVRGGISSSSDTDIYSFTVTPNLPTTLVLTGDRGTATLELRDGTGATVALGTSLATNVSQLIADFVDASGGQYYAVITGSANEQYDLAVVRGAGFDAEPNDANAVAQDLNVSGQTLGAVLAGFDVTESHPGFTFPTVATVPFDNVTFVGSDVTMTVTARLDLSASSEYLTMDGEGIVSNVFFQSGGSDSSIVSAQFTITRDQFNQMLLDDGVATFTFTPTSAVNFIPASAFLDVRLQSLQDTDVYRFEANVGDALTLTTSTPFGEPQQPNLPSNNLDPRLELLFGTTLVAQDNDGAADFKNATINYTVPTGAGGTYFAAVKSAAQDGPYTLSITGATAGGPTEFAVSAVTPAAASLVNTFPTQITVAFEEAVLLTSLAPSDLLLNGTGADAVTAVDGDTLRFDIASLDTGDGSYTVSLAAGALTSVSGKPLSGFSSSFTLDATSPTVTGVTANSQPLLAGDVLPRGAATFTFSFSENLADADVGPEDIVLTESVSGLVLAPDSFSKDLAGSPPTVTATYNFLEEGVYTAALISSGDAYRDPAGNPLDGDPGQAGSEDFQLTFAIDTPSDVPIPTPLNELEPAGALLYDPPVTGLLHAAGDTDSFTISVESGQLVTLVATPLDAGLQLGVELLDDVPSSLGSHSASAPGEPARVQTIPSGAGGPFTIQVSSLGGVGRFELSVFLNARVEEETIFDTAPSNDTIAAAEPLNGSDVALPGGGRRLGAVGNLSVGTFIDITDIGFTEGVVAGPSRALTYSPSSGGFLFSDGGTLYDLTTAGAASPLGTFDHLAKGLAFVGSTLYSVDRNSATLRELNPADGATLNSTSLTAPGETIVGAFALATDPTTDTLWGLLELSSSGFSSLARIDQNTGAATLVGNVGDWFSGIAFDANGRLLGITNSRSLNGPGNLFDISTVDAGTSLLGQLAPATGNGETLAWNPLNDRLYRAAGFSQTFQSIEVTTRGDAVDHFAFDLAAGETATLGVAGVSGAVSLELLDAGGNALAAGVTGASNVDASISDFVSPTAGSYIARVSSTSFTDYGLVIAVDAGFGLEPNSDPASAQPLGPSNRVLTSVGTDHFTFVLNQPTTLTLATSTPGDGPGEPANSLDPRLTLFAPDGSTLGADDNSAADGRNALLVASATQTGQYRVAVEAVAGSGPVVLSVSSSVANAIADDPFQVVGTDPVAGQIFGAFPDTYRIDLSDAVLLTSLVPEDLTLVSPQGANLTARSVSLIDGDTLEFDISGLSGEEGSFSVAMAAGSLTSVSGAPLAALASNFLVDLTPPQVTSVSVNGTLLNNGDTVPAGPATMEVVFDEPLESQGVGAEDLQLLETLSNTVLNPTSVNQAGSVLTLQFAELPEGRLDLTLVSGLTAFRDLAGNPLDGSGDGGTGDFTFTFSTDLDLRAFPVPLEPHPPAGSLIHDQRATGYFHAAADADTYTIDVEAGQTISLLLTPADSSIQPTLELRDPAGATLDTSVAVAAGEPVVLQTLPAASAGTYEIVAGSALGSGTYELRTVLNAYLESEGTTTAAGSNDLPSGAENLDGSAVALQAGADRLGLLGTFSGQETDTFRVTLSAGQAMSVALVGGSGAALSLLDGSGTLLAAGIVDDAGTDQAIFDFVAPSAGTYFLQLSGGAASQTTEYSLVASRDALFEPEFNDSFASAAPIDLTRQVLAFISEGVDVTQTQSGSVFTPNVLTFEFPNLPPSTQDVTLDVSAVADLDLSSEFIALDAEGFFSQNLFVSGGSQGGTSVDQATIPAAAYNQIVADGVATLTFRPSSSVNSFINPNSLTVTLTAPQESDRFRFQAAAGDAISLVTTTPGSAPGEPVNGLSPSLELFFDNGGTPVSKATGVDAGDGRNERIDYIVPAAEAGTYFVEVTGNNLGAYTLALGGATGPTSAPRVTAASPNDSELVSTFPSTFQTDFSEALLLNTLQNSDLLITLPGGATMHPTGFSAVDGDTIAWDLGIAAPSDGIYRVDLAQGALQGVTGRPVDAFQSTFQFDATPPTVLNVNINGTTATSGSVVPDGPTTIEILLSEPLNEVDLGPEDVSLAETSTATAFAPDTFQFDAVTNVLTLSYADLPEGNYTLALDSSATGFRDLLDNLLDGDTSQAGFEDFTLSYVADTTVAPLPVPLEARMPAGSLIHDSSYPGIAHTTGDQDELTVSIDANQTATILLTPLDAGLQATLELLDASGNVLASAPAAGAPGLIQTAALSTSATETYTLRVTATAGSGGYGLRFVLNALLEDEALGGAANDTLATAQDLDPSAIPFGLGSAERLGLLDGVVDADGGDDYFALPLLADQTASMALQSSDSSVELELFDPGGALIAQGIPAANVSRLIDGLLPAQGGTYTVRVSGPAGATYNLIVTRGGQFERERNDDAATAQRLIFRPEENGLSSELLGARLGGTRDIEPDRFSAGTDLSSAYNDVTLSIVQADGVTPSGAVPRAQTSTFASTGSSVFAQNTSTFFNSSSSWLRADFAVPSSRVTIDVIGDDSFDPGVLRAYDAAGNLLQEVTGFSTSAGNPQTLVIDRGVAEISYILAAGLGGDTAALDNLTATGDEFDHYVVSLEAGDTFEVRTATPGGEAGEPVNGFDPQLSLFNSQGFLVVADDNGAADGRNARINFSVIETGEYLLRVGGSDTGSYSLLATLIADLGNPAPEVVATVPDDGQPSATPPATLRVEFSEGMRLDSFDAADLQFANPAVSVDSVAVVAGNAALFSLTVPDVDGVYEYTLAGDAVTDLQGVGNAIHQGSFVVDKTGPRVIDTAPSLQASAPFSTLTFTFDEAVDAASISLADVGLSGPAGNITLDTLEVTGAEVTVTFAAQSLAGTYVFNIGPDLLDLAGNSMDQDGDGTGGEATEDEFIAPLVLSSPDLRVRIDDGPNNAVFGQDVTLEYTATNAGSDPAQNQWVDRVWLSTDGNVDASDLLLATIPQTSGKLGPLDAASGPNNTYTRQETVSLPLNASSQAGAYFLLLEVDALNEQAESSETNNVDSRSLTLTLPPLPDLVVSDITAPAEALSGQDITITWTLSNQGSGDFNGMVRDQIFLSSDAAFGNDQFFGNFDATVSIPAGQSVTRQQVVRLPDTQQGDFFTIIRTDASNQTFEEPPNGESNNVTVDDASFRVDLRPFPNLQVTSVTAPPTAFSSQQAVVEWVVTNTGGGPTNAPSWSDGVWLSLDNVLDQTDTFLGRAANPSFLNPGDSYSSQLQVTLPQGIDNDYFFIVKADDRNQLLEFQFEDDNTRAGGPTDVALTPPPDLLVSSVNAPTTAFSGQTATLSWTVLNDGDGATLESFWRDRVYLSTDTLLDQNDTLLATRNRSGVLASGDSYTVDQEVTLPIGQSGEFYFIVQTDTFNQVFEQVFEGNNTGFDSSATNVILTPPPDLEVVLVDAPNAARAGGELTLAYEVTNFGATQTPNTAWNDRFFLSSDTTLDPETDVLLGTWRHYGALDSGDSYTASFSFTLPNTLAGDYFAIVQTDSGAEVFEIDFVPGNNVGLDPNAVTITSQPADLVVTNAAAPASGVTGQSLAVEWTVTNTGVGDTIVAAWNDRLYLSTDNVFSTDDPQLGSLNRGGLLNPADSYTSSLNVSLPFNLEPGNYSLFVATDRGNQVFESSESNNVSPPLPLSVTQEAADLQVTSVTIPGSAVSATEIPVQWTVENFGANRTSSNTWFDEIYLSGDATIDSSDLKLASVRRSNGLAGGEQYTTSETVRLPFDLEGDFFVLVRTDATGQVFEAALDNNNDGASAATMTVSRNPSPDPDLEPLPADLVVAGVDAPGDALSGQQFPLTWTVRNDGLPTGNRTWVDSIYLSLDQIFDSSDTFLGSWTRGGGLETGQSYTRTESVGVPRGLAGPWYVFVATDSTRRILETNDLNNLAFDPLSMQVTLPPPADLVLGTITVPANGVPGQSVTITYTVENQGTSPALGSWFDTLYISDDDQWDIGDAFLARTRHVGNVPGGGSYTETVSAPLPGLLPGEYHVIVRSDILNAIPELDESNNIGASLDRSVIDAEELLLDIPASGTLAAGQSVFYKVEVPAGETLIVALDSDSPTATNELYVSFEEVPSRTEFDYSFSDPLAADQRVVVPATRGGTYYVLARGNSSPDGAAGFAMEANLLSLSILDLSITEGSNRGEVTVVLEGAKFAPNGAVSLVDPGGSTRDAATVRWKDSSTLWATFDLRGLSPALYDIRVAQGNESTTLDDAFTVNAKAAGSFQASLSVPSALRPGQQGVLRVDYANVGMTDVVAPILVVSADNASLKPAGASSFLGDTIEVLAINDAGPAGILPPGARGSFLFTFDPQIANGQVDFSVESILPSNLAIDWSDFKDDVKPTHLPQDAWDAVYANLSNALGTTVADYLRVLADNATHLSVLDQYESDVQALLAFELAQANNTLLAATPLSNATDLVTPTPGLSLGLARVYPSTLSGRFELGPLGRGWKHLWEISAETSDLGNVLIRDARAQRFFILQADGGYRTLGGEQGLLTLDGGRYMLREADGTRITFRADGKLDQLLDINGTGVTAGYTGDLLTSLTHSNGNQLSLSYNANGRITHIAESGGRTASYAYDAGGEHLVSVTGPEGVTLYTYDSGNGLQREHALLSVQHPGGTQELYEYDAAGRLISESLNAGIEAQFYAYDTAGGVTISDVSGATTNLMIDASGLIGQLIDPLNRGMLLRYDAENNLAQTVLPGNLVTNYTYDDRGNLIQQIDALGNTYDYSYDAISRLLSLTDARDNTIEYVYDSRGNQIGILYPDGTSEAASYDAQGNLVELINRRGQTVNYEYDNDGNLIRRVFPDGSEVTFTYDARGNRLTATDSRGVTTFTYDAADRVTQVLYPSGRRLDYTYDAGGRRTGMVDQDGNAINYQYDAAGRLVRLIDDDGNLIVDYTYDAIGQLSRSDQGNGTYTTYSYDAAGQLTSLVHFAADGSENSRFDYTYDDLRRLQTATTAEGVTSYTYDAIGQLIGVELPGGRFIEYTYDAAGNRLTVDDNGVLTQYTANNVNQYTAIASSTLTYDADGNLVALDDGLNEIAYGYDAENRLISVDGPAGVTLYEYDAFGNRIASAVNGQRTEYLVDLAGVSLPDVLGEYDGAGNLIARYTHGLGLVSRTDASNLSAYYDFDQLGSVVGLTGAAGTVLNAYSYLPFGELLSASETIANPFQFAGQTGVMREENGLNFMRARFYVPEQGRFLNPDPDGIVGGFNLYAYAQNDPVNFNDPSGLGKGKIIGWIIEQTAKGRWQRKAPLHTNKQVREAIDNGYDVSVRDSKHFAGQGQRSELHKSRRGEQQLRHRHPNPRTGSHIIQRGLAITAPLTLSHHAEAHAADNVPVRVAAEVLCFFNPLALPNDILSILDAIDGLFPEDDGSTSIVRPSDPNDIVGPDGFGPENFVTAAETLPYTIRFENMSTATAPAQEVRITHPLDADLDLRTIRFDDFGWGGFVFDVPAPAPFLNERIDLTDEHGFLVDVVASLNPVEGVAEWLITTIDPATGEKPESPLVGFLPPNNDEGVGDGFVTYSVRSRRTAQTGDVIDAVATIVFDTEGPIDTPPIFNTLDAVAPASRIDPLPATSNAPEVTLQWSGSDDAGGSAIGGYTIWVSEDGGPFEVFLDGTTLTEAVFVGTPGSHYEFYSTARDNAGNVEPPPTAPDAAITVAGGDTTPPTIVDVADVDPDPRAGAVQSVEVEFSEELDLSTFTVDDLTLTRNGGQVTLTSDVTVSLVSGTTYRIEGLAPFTVDEGQYEITVDAANISDLAGNAGSGADADSWLTDSTEPNSVVDSLPQVQTSKSFNVQVTAGDPTSGGVASGLLAAEIYTKVDGGPWTLWTTVPTGNLVATYNAQSNQSIAFYSIAIDAAGNREQTAPQIQASTYVPDLDAPVTQVDSVDSSDATLEITFSGIDTGGSGLAAFDLFVQVDNGTPKLVGQFDAGKPDASGVHSGSAVYQAISDGSQHAYRFYTVGVDVRGNQEAAPAAPGDVSLQLQFATPSELATTHFDVQRGAIQRSFVRYLDVTFNQSSPLAGLVDTINDADAGNDRVRLLRFGLDGSGTGEIVPLAGKLAAVDHVMKFDFGVQGIGGNRNSNVGDGYYQLLFDLDGDGFDTDDASLNFYRLLGNVNTDRLVSNDDVSAILAALGESGANLNEDANGDGVVSGTDRFLALLARGRSLDASLPLDD